MAFAPHWTVQEDLFQKQAKFTFIPYRGDLQTEHGIADQVYYTYQGLPKDSKIKDENGKMHLELSNIPAFEQEEFIPPEDIIKMRVDFYYGDRQMAKADEFWKSEGKYWNKEAEKFLSHGGVAAAANQAIAPSDTPEQKVRKIYARVQQVKNLSYEADRSDLEDKLENRKDNKNVEDVLRQGGYRDEITRLFVAMVRAVNIPAYLMRVATRDEIIFQPSIPNWRQLNSEVAVVHLGDKDVFLDPGTRFCPYGLLEWTRTGVKGIRQNAAGGTEFAETPIPSYADTITQRIARLKLDETGSLKGQALLSFTGQEALSHRIEESKTDEAGRTKALEDELRALLPATATVKLNSLKGWDNPNERLDVIFDVEIPGYANSTGKRLLLPTSLFQVNSKQPFTHAERKNPIYFYYPYRDIDDVQITFPANLQVESVPKIQPLKTEFAIYMAEHTTQGTAIRLRRDFAVGNIAYPIKLYPQIKSFYEGVKSGDDEQAVLRATAAVQAQ